MPSNATKRIIGIDPGIERVGVAILEKKDGKEVLLHSSCIRTDPKLVLAQRIKKIGQAVSVLIKKYYPDTLATERLYFNTNQKTAMAVAEARGVIIYQASIAGLEIVEFTPPQIKNAVSGYGRSDKNQVRAMVKTLLKIDKKNALDDEIDAIAIALTAAAHVRFLQNPSISKSLS